MTDHPLPRAALERSWTLRAVPGEIISEISKVGPGEVVTGYVNEIVPLDSDTWNEAADQLTHTVAIPGSGWWRLFSITAQCKGEHPDMWRGELGIVTEWTAERSMLWSCPVAVDCHRHEDAHARAEQAHHDLQATIDDYRERVAA